MKLTFEQMTADGFAETACWRYPPPYDFYDGDVDAFGRRKAVRDEGGLQRDDRPTARERLADLLRDLDHRTSSMSRNGTTPQRANVRLCSPTTRNPARS